MDHTRIQLSRLKPYGTLTLITLLFLVIYMAPAKSTTKIGFDNIHREYFAPEVIYIDPYVDVKNEGLLKLDELKICQQMKNIIEESVRGSVKSFCVENMTSPDNPKNLYLQLRIKEERAGSLISYSVVLISERREVQDFKRYSLSEGFNYRFIPHQGKKTEKMINDAIDGMTLVFAGFLKESIEK